LEYGPDKVAPYIDKIKKFGFKYATYSGITWSLDDIKVPKEKESIVKESKNKVLEVEGQYEEGLITEEERITKSVEIWQDTKGKVEKSIEKAFDKTSPVYDIWKSGARGSLAQIVQMVGMKGMITNIMGETIEFPVVSSYKEGLTPIEYFTTTHGSRKGLTDTALNTQKPVILPEDCSMSLKILLSKKLIAEQKKNCHR
jgi:DNA-directed RNA polymerase subunit beta'